MTEKEKMLSGKLYYGMDEELFSLRQNAKRVLFEYNNTNPDFIDKSKELLKTIIPKIGNDFFMEPPFRCDYGLNIEIGDYFYSNYNLTILDCARVKIGNHVMFGPNVSIFTAGHPVDKDMRNKELEYAFGITIGNDVWIGGNTTILPGVTIGDNVVIGAGSVITKDIDSNVVAFGNPCKTYRKIDESDKLCYYKNMPYEN